MTDIIYRIYPNNPEAALFHRQLETELAPPATAIGTGCGREGFVVEAMPDVCLLRHVIAYGRRRLA